MSVVKHSALNTGIDSIWTPSQAVLKSSVGYWFDLQNVPIFGPAPANQFGIANALTGGIFLLPVQYNLQANFVIQIDYNTQNGGSGWSGNLRLAIAPCTVTTDSLGNSDGGEMTGNTLFPNTTWCVMAENWGAVPTGTTGATILSLQYSSQNLMNNPGSGSLNQLAMAGTFKLAAWWDNLVNTATGDSFNIVDINMIIPFSSGVNAS